MKLTKNRMIAFYSAILACVVSSGLLLMTTEKALAANECEPIPTPTVGYEIPINPSYDSYCNSVNFADFAWQSFVALNWPAEGNGLPLEDETIGSHPEKPRVWENYEFPEQVFEDDDTERDRTIRFAEVGPKFGKGPNFGIPELKLRTLNSILQSNDSTKESIGLPNKFKPLVDRAGNYILNEVRMNPIEVNQIVSNGWNSVAGLRPFKKDSEKPFQLMCSAKEPRGVYPYNSSTNVPCWVEEGNKSVGSMEIKAAWMVLPDPDTPLPSDTQLPDPTQYYTTTRSLYVETPENNEGKTSLKTTKVEVPVALVGFHIIRKTSQAGWIWSTFEHIDNAPDSEDLPTRKHYNLYDPDCRGDCTVNTPLAKRPYLWQSEFPHAVTKKNGKIQAQTPSQITRLVPIQETAKLLNYKWQNSLPSFWKNYRLIGVQWLENPTNPYNMRERGVLPGNLANVTLEPYVQKKAPGNSCIACHTHATLPTPNYPPADFSFLMQEAK